MTDTLIKRPHVTVNVAFVPYGYQLDILVDGETHLVTLCRDFGGSHPIKKLQKRFIKNIEGAVEAFRKGL